MVRLTIRIPQLSAFCLRGKAIAKSVQAPEYRPSAGLIGHFHYLRTMADYYRHFKGGKYKLLGIAKDSETLEKMVVYQALYGEGELWVRPEEMFFGTVERDGKVMQRFTKISEEEVLGNE